jgi:hypothetical protein
LSLYRRDDRKTWWISINSGGRRIRQYTENEKLAEKIHAKKRGAFHVSNGLSLSARSRGKVVDVSGGVFPMVVRSLRAAFDKTLDRKCLAESRKIL